MPSGVRRHQLVVVKHDHCHGLGLDARLESWFAEGRPGIVRRPCISASNRLCLGIPLPPSQGKLRLSCEIPLAAVQSRQDPPRLAACLAAAPPRLLLAPLRELCQQLEARRLPCHAIGSLAWQTVTGLTYIRPESDIDLVLPVANRAQFDSLDQVLSAWLPRQTHKYDIEIMLPNGDGFLWKEHKQTCGEILVKGNARVFMASLQQLLP